MRTRSSNRKIEDVSLGQSHLRRSKRIKVEDCASRLVNFASNDENNGLEKQIKVEEKVSNDIKIEDVEDEMSRDSFVSTLTFEGRSREGHKCSICDKTIQSRFRLKEHLETHLPMNERTKYECTRCGRIFINKGKWSNHCRRHKPEHQLRCTICDKVMSCNWSLKRHYQFHQKIKVERGIQSEQHRNSKGLDLHEMGHSLAVKSEIYACSLCNKRYLHRMSLSRHNKMKHSFDNKRTIYKCSTCGKMIKSKWNFKEHKKTHLPDDQRIKYNCPFCDKVFFKKSNCTTHQNLHPVIDKKSTYKCCSCGKVCMTSRTLRAHQETHLPDNKRTKYKCSLCNKMYLTFSSLKRHQLTHLPLQKRKKHTCDVCNKELYTRSGLINHRNAHLPKEEGIYKCPKCSYCSFRKDRLLNHEQTHLPDSERKIYSCLACNKSYKTLSSLCGHKRSAHS